MFRLALAAFAALMGAAHAQNSSASLPTVDLGYELYRAASYNATGHFYNFTNIRYAAPPLGDLRFAAPQAPAENRSAIQDSAVHRICPQGAPKWNEISSAFITGVLTGQPIDNYTTTPYVPPIVNMSTPIPEGGLGPGETEDCLFLDVFTPEQVWKNRGQGYGAPVLVWIYGGGYTAGVKNGENPAGLLARSGNVTNGEIIYVGLNYRLGALGWTAGPTFNAEGGVSNAGLLDQRFALEWIQKYIHLFGGDPNKVTVMGESAGGGSIMHQITAYGGSKGKVPFQQAIPQSPGWETVSSSREEDDFYKAFLNVANVSSVAELRNMSSKDLMKANYLRIWSAVYSSYNYGPVVDGDFVPEQPGQLLATGRFDKSVNVMVGHNSNEGAFFTPPYVNSTDTIQTHIHSVYPSAQQDVVDYITDTLYPEPSNSTPYSTEFNRADLITSEAIFTCNTYYLSRAFGNKTYSYLFGVPPSLHGQDVSFTYYDGGYVSRVDISQVTNQTLAFTLQDFITSFTKTGRPVTKIPGIPEFPMYGADAHLLDLNVTGVKVVPDSNANERCAWWQKALIT